MKKNAKFFIYLLCIIFVSACGKAPVDAEPAALYTQISLTVAAQLTAATPFQTAVPSLTLPAVPTSTATPSAVIPTPTRIFPPTINAKIDPAIDPAKIESSLAIETLDAFNGHDLRRISGWSKGFDGFEWVDAKHLLLYAITGKAYGEGAGNNKWFSHPAMINLDSGKVWLPPTAYPAFPQYLRSFLAKNSTQAAVVVASDTNNGASVYSLDGELVKTYQGKLIGISPSRSKILLVENDFQSVNIKVKWIDLRNNQEVLFSWEQFANAYDCCKLIWSSDEMKVYYTTYGGKFYGNAKNGEGYKVADMAYDEENAEHLIDWPQHSYGTWVLNDTYLLAGWNEHDEGVPNFISFFDPAKKAYRNLSALAGLPYVHEVSAIFPDPPFPCDDGLPLAIPGGRYVWVNCQDGGRLIDMQTFKAKAFPDYPEAKLEWSADGSFAFLRHSSNDFSPQILSAAGNQLKAIPAEAVCSTTWHPKQNVFAYLSKNGYALSIFDPHSMLVQKTVALPASFNCPVWNTPGNKLMLRSWDDSLWQIDYPALSHLTQLTKPIRGLKDFASSPDGTLIAFPVDTDIYIVDTSSKP